ncbi:hypothetical protein OTSUT76_2302 [Orientia tsutsugamushi str. UT76]|nr:hypothetical protein OTSUT76_2302 [Orientia tsutsugamushi str. UT76]
MLEQLNPTLTQKEDDIIAWWKVQLSQRQTHSGRYDNVMFFQLKKNFMTCGRM